MAERVQDTEINDVMAYFFAAVTITIGSVLLEAFNLMLGFELVRQGFLLKVW